MMDLIKSTKLLKIYGVFSIIGSAVLAGLGTVVAVMSRNQEVVTKVGEALKKTNFLKLEATSGTVAMLGVLMILWGAFTLLYGICCVRGVKDCRKIMPAFVLSIVSMVFRSGMLIYSIVQNNGKSNGFSTTAGALGAAIVIFLAANTIRKSGKTAAGIPDAAKQITHTA